MRENVNEIVGIKDDEVYVLQTVFDDNGFKGATGYSMRPLTQSEVDDRLDDAEYYRDLWKQAVENDQTDLGLDEFVQEANEEAEMDGLYYCGDDDSFRSEFEDLIEELPEAKKKQLESMTDLSWTVCGCGRHFTKNMKFDVVFNKKLVDLINKYEEE